MSRNSSERGDETIPFRGISSPEDKHQCRSAQQPPELMNLRADEPLQEGHSRVLRKAHCTNYKQVAHVLWHKQLMSHKAGTKNPKHTQCCAADMSVTHHSERVEEIVESPGNDDDVVDVQPEGENHSCQSNS